MTVPALACRGLTVAYGAQVVLEDVDLDVADGETLAVLGPSGSGKTTLLYAVAGFVPPTRGEIHLAGEVVAAPGRFVDPEHRRVAVVFQHYALWPHLNALDTVAYPLRRAGSARATARREARELLARMDVADLAARRPAELSGGQQQRVGVARALARHAGLYLLDEPTAHLDTMLRERLADELARRRAETGAAAVYATHDASEALALADRVALLRAGRLVQVGSPAQVWDQPVDAWSAHLTGPASLLAGRVTPGPCLWLGGERVETAMEGLPAVQSTEADVTVVVRPGWARLGGPLDGTVLRIAYRGPHTDHVLDTSSGEVVVRHDGPPRLAVGERTGWSLDRAWVVPA